VVCLSWTTSSPRPRPPAPRRSPGGCWRPTTTWTGPCPSGSAPARAVSGHPGQHPATHWPGYLVGGPPSGGGWTGL